MAQQLTQEFRHKLERGLESYRSRSFAAAEAIFSAAIEEMPTNFDASNLLGVTVNAQGRFEEAVDIFRRAIALRPDHPGAQTNLGMALRALGRWREALAVYDKVIALQPDFAMAYTNRGGVYLELADYPKAISDYDTSLKLRPGDAMTWELRGRALRKIGRASAACESFTRAIELDGTQAEYFASRGKSLDKLNRKQEAINDFGEAWRLSPEQSRYLGYLISCKRSICDWSRYEQDQQDLVRLVERGDAILSPWRALSAFSSAELQLKAARSQSSKWVKTSRSRPPSAGKKIRLGFYSTNWEQHPIMLLLLEVLALIDRDRFHLAAFAYPVAGKPADRRDLSLLFDAVVDLSGVSDEEAAAKSREMNIDLAVDLDGFTTNSRPGIFAHRAAPIQVNYLGYSGTLGVDYMDYIVADKTIIPAEVARFYVEQLAWLPTCYMPRDRRLSVARPGPSRVEEGLPATAVTFCCFNNDFKITPDIFADWMTILRLVPDSVLWLRNNDESATTNLRRAASEHGIETDRLIFAKRVSLEDHFARIAHADLVLDTPIYNAHTTASDALYAGVPVLTRPGEAFASRVAASLLNAIGMPELIVGSREEYVELAVAIGNDPGRVKALKEKLARNRDTYPLFDMESYTRHLEAAFTEMVDRHRKGLPPDHIEVAP